MKEQKNTVVNLRTREEYNEYMEMCEAEGWVWLEGQQPMNFDGWVEVEERTCIYIGDGFSFRSLERARLKNNKIITLEQLKSGDDIGFFELFE